jgi:hypothetical protein
METQRPGKRELKYIILHILGQAGMEPRREARVLLQEKLRSRRKASKAPQVCRGSGMENGAAGCSAGPTGETGKSPSFRTLGDSAPAKSQ